MVSLNVDWEKYRLFSVCISWYMISKTFSLIMLFVKETFIFNLSKKFYLLFRQFLKYAFYMICTQRLLSVRRSKYCLECSIAWGRLKISVTVPFMYNFRSLSNKFTTIFWSLIFHILLPRLGYFSQKKGNQKFSDSKRWRREESEKLSLSYYIKLHLKFWGKILKSL